MRVAAKGWCPGAYRPMESGDGLIVRIRPVLARLGAVQVLGLCDAAEAHGSGIVELTSRANLQLRGVRPEAHEALLEALWRLDLLDADPAIEGRRNVLVAPLWSEGDATAQIAQELIARLAELPDLPAKFGFAVDGRDAPMLGGCSADIRVERGVSGGLIVRADGCTRGEPVTAAEAVDRVIARAHWFAESRGAAGRMARHPGLAAAEGTEAPARPAALPGPGASPLGPVVGVAFGQMEAGGLARLVRESRATAVRVTPERCLLLEGGQPVTVEGFLGSPDPLLAADACAGAPFCPAATVATRGLARRLAGRVAGLHVSGCAKGCARARPAAVTLVGRSGAFDLVRNGAAWDAPVQTGLAERELLEMFGADDASV